MHRTGVIIGLIMAVDGIYGESIVIIYSMPTWYSFNENVAYVTFGSSMIQCDAVMSNWRKNRVNIYLVQYIVQ